MTERDSRPAEGLTPAQSEAVRRLLAGARHDEGIPDEVAVRLDAAIADLAAERAAAEPVDDRAPSPAREAAVIPLRRRRWPQLLVAAAAVTLFGFGVTQMTGNSGTDAGGGSTAEKDAAPEVASSEDLGDDGAAVGGEPESAPVSPEDGRTALSDPLLSLTQRSLSELGIKGLRVLRAGTLARDLQKLIPPETAATAHNPRGYATLEALPCGPYYTVDGGETYAASYRSHLALVLFHPALDGARLVEVYDCEGVNPRQKIRTVTLQAGE